MGYYRHTKANWPVSASELKARHAECKKEENMIFAVFLPAFFLFLFLCVAGADFVESLEKWIEQMVIILFFVVLIAANIFVIKNISDRRNAYDLRCPGCGQFLIQRKFKYALENGTCSRCSRQLIQTGH